MSTETLVIGPPSWQDDASSRSDAVTNPGIPFRLALQAAASASFFTKVRLSLFGSTTLLEDVEGAASTAETLVPRRLETVGALYLAGVSPEVQAALLDRIPSTVPVVLGVSEDLGRRWLRRLGPVLKCDHDKVVILRETILDGWHGADTPEDVAARFLAAGANAVLMLMRSGDLVLTLSDHCFIIRGGLLDLREPSVAFRERVGGAMAGYLSALGHTEVPYLRKASLVAFASALAPRDNALGRPERWHVQRVARRLEGLTAFSPSPATHVRSASAGTSVPARSSGGSVATEDEEGDAVSQPGRGAYVMGSSAEHGARRRPTLRPAHSLLLVDPSDVCA